LWHFCGTFEKKTYGQRRRNAPILKSFPYLWQSTTKKTKKTMLATKQQPAIQRMQAYAPMSNDTLINDDTLMTKDELFDTMNNAFKELAQGEYKVVHSDKELRDYFASL
jgi:hypothetical protein